MKEITHDLSHDLTFYSTHNQFNCVRQCVCHSIRSILEYLVSITLVQPKKMLIKKYLASDAKDFARLQVNFDLDFLIWSDRFKFSFQNLWCRRKVQKTLGFKLFIGGPVLHPKTVIRFFVECNFVQILGPFSPENKI